MTRNSVSTAPDFSREFPAVKSGKSSRRFPGILCYNKQAIWKGKPQSDDLLERSIQFHHFFNPNYPEKAVLDKDHSRFLHNANGIGLSNRFGALVVWFQIEKGKTLHEPGGAIGVLVIRGEGMLEYEDQVVHVFENEYYELRPEFDSNIYIRNEKNEPLEILYFHYEYGLKKKE